LASVTYSQSYFRTVSTYSREAAAAAVPTIVDLFRPLSVVDVGGGVGAWAAEFLRLGVPCVITVDGEYVNEDDLQVPRKSFIAHDLRHPFDLGRKFDLVLSLEVAEHLEVDHTATFIDSLTRHGDLIVFSAAIPGQGGTHHVNEQWPSYWERRFAARGYELFDILRPRLWDEQRIGFWFRQNMLVLARGAAAERARAVPDVPRPIDVVHPEEFTHWIRVVQQPLGIRQSARALRVAVERRARRTLRR
jgi:hypothetical protein